jgi:LysM repeat protein
MNNPSPLIPQGSMLEQKNKSRTRVRLAVFFVLSIHVIGLGALLMQGCRKPSAETDTTTMTADTNTPAPPSMDASNATVAVANPAQQPVTPTVTEPTPAPAPAAQDYTVAKGDSFSSIAKKFGVKTKDIEVANPGIEPTKLQIGQKLHIPAAPATTASTASPNAIPPGAIEMGSTGQQTYTVKSGDTLTKIASEFGTTVKALRSENSLTTDKIKVGDKLKIPTKASSPSSPPPVATNTTA